MMQRYFCEQLCCNVSPFDCISRLWTQLSQAMCIQNSKQLQLYSSQMRVARQWRFDTAVQCWRNCGQLIALDVSSSHLAFSSFLNQSLL